MTDAAVFEVPTEVEDVELEDDDNQVPEDIVSEGENVQREQTPAEKNAASISNREVTVAHTGKSNRPVQFTAKASTMLAISRDLGYAGASNPRTQLATELSKVYTGANPEVDHETDVSVELTSKTYEAVSAAIARLHLTTTEIPYEAPVKAAKEPRAKVTKEMKPCECGCGTLVPRTWAVGHDARHKGVLLKRIDNQLDDSAAAEMVTRGWMTEGAANERMAKAHAKQTATNAKIAAQARQTADGTQAPAEAPVEASA